MGYRGDRKDQGAEKSRVTFVPPIDEEWMAEAQRRRGQISVKAVGEEYDRLLKAKSSRGLLSRLFGQ